MTQRRAFIQTTLAGALVASTGLPGSKQQAAMRLPALSSLLSGAGGGAGGSDHMRARVAKNMPESGGHPEQNCEL